MKSFAKRISQITTPESMAMAQRLKEWDGRKKILDLTWGQPDFDTPGNIKKAAIDAVLSGKNGYTHSMGILELREAVSELYADRYSASFNPESEVLVTPGVKQGLMYLMQVLINPGDEVILFEPCWLSYKDMVLLNGGVPIAIPTGTDLAPDVSMLEQKMSPRVKAIVINSPVNPSGYIFSSEELAHIAQLANKFGLFIIGDEIYDRIVFEEFFSLSQLDSIKENLIVANGFSKTYAMTGWRIGYLLGPSAVISKVNMIHQQTATCAPAVSQYAALAALSGDQSTVDKMVLTYKERIDILLNGLENSNFKVVRPGGTFYSMVHVPDIVTDGYDSKAEFMLGEYGIACVNGKPYGESCSDYVRFSLTLNAELLKSVVSRLIGNKPIPVDM